MSKPLQPLLALLALAVVFAACALPIPSLPPGPPTQDTETATPPFSPEDVGTAVAATLTALVPVEPGSPTPEISMTSSPAPGESPAALPHTFYYLAPDSAGLMQLFRVEQDGGRQLQITSEAADVSAYDVSPVDGGVAYISNNQLLYINADRSERRVLVDGGPIDPNNPFISRISSPVFARDGMTLAYGYKGLQIYSFAYRESELVLENQIDDAGGGLFVPRELYSPERYSPDGTKLLVTLGYYEGASSAVYDPTTRDLVRLEGGEGALICCDNVEWSADSSSFYAASSSAGMFAPGLWKVDAATGEVSTLIQGDVGGGNYQAAREAYLAPDGRLYFFFGAVSSPEGMFSRAPLQLVRAAPDGVTDRTVLRPDTFDLMNEALWAPDASLVVIAIAPAAEVYQGGRAEIVYLDGRPDAELAPLVTQMKWGP